MNRQESLIASRAQALLLGCLEEHERRDEAVYLYGETGASRLTAVAHAEEHGPLLGLEYFFAVDESLPALVAASLPVVRRATVDACARRGWITDGGVEEFETQRLGTSWFATKTLRLRRVEVSEDGRRSLLAYRLKPAEPVPKLGGVEREIVELAARAEMFGYVLVPVTDDAKRAARALARTPFARRGWGGGPSTRSLHATATGEVEIGV